MDEAWQQLVRERAFTIWLRQGSPDGHADQFSLMAELPGKRTLPFGKDSRAAKDVARASRTLLDRLSLLRDGIGLSDPPIPTAPITAFEDDVPDRGEDETRGREPTQRPGAAEGDPRRQSALRAA